MNTTILSLDPTMTAAPSSTGPVVGVRTTRIYCRPVCRPGRAPRRENCVPFPDGTSAREAGYRPCKQCRPDEARGQDRAEAAGPTRYGVGTTPLGPVFVAMTDRGVCRLELLEDDDPAPALERLAPTAPGPARDPATIAPVVARLSAHLLGGDPCDDLPLDVRGTPFQQRVWAALRAIPRGQTRTYGQVAEAVGAGGAARAVGAACGANRVLVLIPCHRVVASGGSLSGFAAGLPLKRALLDLERP